VRECAPIVGKRFERRDQLVDRFAAVANGDQADHAGQIAHLRAESVAITQLVLDFEASQAETVDVDDQLGEIVGGHAERGGIEHAHPGNALQPRAGVFCQLDGSFQQVAPMQGHLAATAVDRGQNECGRTRGCAIPTVAATLPGSTADPECAARHFG